MATYSDTLQALTDFRSEVLRRQQTQPAAVARSLGEGAFSAFSTPMNNVHATGVGLRVRSGRPVINEHVLKMFVYEKLSPEALGEKPMTEFRGVPVDVEQLPIQMALS